MVDLANGQAEIRADEAGALLVGDDTDFVWVLEGPSWWAAPEVRTTDQARSGADGYVGGRDLLGKHVTTLQVTILGDSESDVGDKIDLWKAACAHKPEGTVTIRANFLGRTRIRFGRFRIPGEANAELARVGYVAIGSAQFEVLDSRTYSDEQNVVVTGREVAGAGVTVPFVVPFTLGASAGGSVTVPNDGTMAAPWTARLTGPLTLPEILNLDTGQRLAFTANGGVDLAAAEWLDIDSARRSVLFAGIADRRTQLSIDSEWWDIDPGGTNLKLIADAGDGLLTVTVRDAFYS